MQTTKRWSELAPVRGSVVAAALIAALGTGPAGASIPITLDVSDGFTFSGVDPGELHLRGIGQLPLGPNFATTPTLVELFLQGIHPNTVRAVFPGQGGQTIQIDTGNPILFEYAAEGMTFQVRLTSIGTPGFGGGLGNTIEFDTMADLKGSGRGFANINQPNLGFLTQIDYLSLLLGKDGSFLGEHPLGVDLNGDGTLDILSLNNLISIVPPGGDPGVFASSIVGNDIVFENVLVEDWLGSGAINPNFGLTLDTVEWTITQEITVRAVPEPSSAALLAVGGLLLSLGRPRRS